MDNQKHNIIIVSHKFLTQPDDDLVLFLNDKKYANVLHIRHSFADAADRCSYFTWYQNGEIYREYRTKDFKNLSEPLIYLKELFFTVKWVRTTSLVWDAYIGMDGLCALFGILLRFIKRVRKVIYWAIDFVPAKRFASWWKNKIYHVINVYGYRHVDEMWDLGVRMVEAREKFLDIKKTDYKSHRVVPYGVWTDRIKKYDYERCEKNSVVFMGHLLEKQGAQLIMAVMPEVIEKIPDFKFKIIGGGPFKEPLINLAKELNILSHCDFRGKIDDIKELEDEIAKSGVAVAPYIKNLDTWSYYADPGKIKTYLACGIPVLLTDIPWNAKDIASSRCGLIISEDKDDIITKLLELMRPEVNREYRQNAVTYSASFDYKNIFSSIIF